MKEDIEITEENTSALRLTKRYLLDLIKSNGLISAVQKFNIPESFIKDNLDEINKDQFIQLLSYGGYVLSEDFLIKLLEKEYLVEANIKDLSMSIYANLSQDFVKKYHDHINWKKMMTYLLSCDKIEDLGAFKEVIEKYKMWSLISATPMSIEFIRENKDELDWTFVKIMNDFTDEELEEFSDYIVPLKDYDHSAKYAFGMEDPRDFFKDIELTEPRVVIPDGASIFDTKKHEKVVEISSKIKDLDSEKLAAIDELLDKMRREQQ